MARIGFDAEGKQKTPNVAIFGKEDRIQEDMASSGKELWAPGVGSCAVFVIVTADKIAGTHVTMATPKDVLKKLFAHVLSEAPGAITALYLAGNSKVWSESKSAMGKSAADFAKFAREQLGKYKGNAYLVESKDAITTEESQACFRFSHTGTAGAVVEMMPQKSAVVPSATELGKLKVVPPAKLVALK